MFNAMKSLIVLCLIVGVIILGVRIHQKSSDMRKEENSNKNELQEKISGIKKEVLSKTEDLGKVYEHVNEKLDEVLDLKKSEVKDDNAKDKDANEIIIDPLDEEDRALTEEILKKNNEKSDQSDLAWELNEDSSGASSEELPLQVSLVEDEKFTPMDLNKAAEIQELYLKAVETLDFK